MLLEDTDTYCSVHSLELIQGRVPILYGLIRYSDEFRAQHLKHFPNSKFLVFGGCVVGHEFFHNMKYCQKCREAHLAWSKTTGCTDGLAPTEDEHEEYIAYISRRMGVPGNIPNQVYELVNSGKIARAIKLLKKENPGHEFSKLKGFVKMLGQKNGK